METNGVDIMCLRETKIPDSCYEVRKGYTFVFSSTSTDREHWGVGLCYNKYIEKYRNYYRQVSSNMIAMELNMHGNPLIIASVHIPHENTNDERIRQRAWEDLTDFVTETSETIYTIIIGDLNTNIHANKKKEEDGHIRPHIYGRGMDFLRNKEHNTPANKTTNREHLSNHSGATDMKVANTYYQKPDKLKGTYQRKDNVSGGPPWSTDRYCELDHCMVKKQWMNSITKIQADPYTNIPTTRHLK